EAIERGLDHPKWVVQPPVELERGVDHPKRVVYGLVEVVDAHQETCGSSAPRDLAGSIRIPAPSSWRSSGSPARPRRSSSDGSTPLIPPPCSKGSTTSAAHWAKTSGRSSAMESAVTAPTEPVGASCATARRCKSRFEGCPGARTLGSA